MHLKMFDKKNKITFMIYFKTTYVFPRTWCTSEKLKCGRNVCKYTKLVNYVSNATIHSWALESRPLVPLINVKQKLHLRRTNSAKHLRNFYRHCATGGLN